MIKSLIILILLVVLSAGLFLTRPTKDDFANYVKEQHTTINNGGLIGQITSHVGSDLYVDSSTFKDKFLWTEIQRDGKTMFYGVFGHWWGNDPNLKPTAKAT